MSPRRLFDRNSHHEMLSKCRLFLVRELRFMTVYRIIFYEIKTKRIMLYERPCKILYRATKCIGLALRTRTGSNER